MEFCKGAEFESYENYNLALTNYCNKTKVNGESVIFRIIQSKKIKDGEFDENIQNIFKYTFRYGICKYRSALKACCDASYKMKLVKNDNGKYVLRVCDFVGSHQNHSKQESQQDQPNQQRNEPNSSSSSKSMLNTLQMISNGILEAADRLEKPQQDALSKVLRKLLLYTQSGVGYTVRFFDQPVGSQTITPAVTVISDEKKTDSAPSPASSNAEEDCLQIIDLTVDDEGILYNFEKYLNIEQLWQTIKKNIFSSILANSPKINPNEVGHHFNRELPSTSQQSKSTISESTSFSKMCSQTNSNTQGISEDFDLNMTIPLGKRVHQRGCSTSSLIKARRKTGDDGESTAQNVMVLIPSQPDVVETTFSAQ